MMEAIDFTPYTCGPTARHEPTIAPIAGLSARLLADTIPTVHWMLPMSGTSNRTIACYQWLRAKWDRRLTGCRRLT